MKVQCEKISEWNITNSNARKPRYVLILDVVKSPIRENLDIVYPIPIRSRPIFFALDLTSALLHLVFPYQHRDLLSYTEFTFRLIDILNPISRFSRIVLDLRFTISAIPFPASIFPILYRIYLSLHRDTVSHSEFFSHRT